MVRSSWLVGTTNLLLPPPRSLQVRYTRRISFRRDARWGRTGVTGTPRVATRPDQLPKEPRLREPCQIRHQDAVKIPGRERYITDSKTAAKLSSGFTIHGCQALQANVLVNVLQRNQIELQNVLHCPDVAPARAALEWMKTPADPRSGARAGGRGFKSIK